MLGRNKANKLLIINIIYPYTNETVEISVVSVFPVWPVLLDSVYL
jgi:hypothetical protein